METKINSIPAITKKMAKAKYNYKVGTPGVKKKTTTK
jgi:hypothetical protein